MTQEQTSDSQRMVGAVLNGRWRLTRLLGEGGMGAVFAASSASGTVAIKILHGEFVGDASVTSRFFAEAEAASRLVHPGIVRVFEATRAEDGTPYMVMELLEGRPLSSYLESRQPLPADQVVYAGRGILEAVGFAHQHGVVHRDLKPENVFVVTGQNGSLFVKVVDFGLAKVMDAAGGMGKRTKTGMLLGTPGYMAPEQIKNAKTVDPRADLFSVGVMVFEMLTGADPFPADNPFEKLTKVLSTEPRSIREVAPELARFEPFFQRALAREPEGRFSSAREMAEMLASLLAGAALPTSVRPPAASRPEHTTQMSQVVPIATPPPGPALSPDQVKVVSLPPPPPAPPPRRIWPFVVVGIGLLCLVIGIGVGFLLAR